MRRTDERLRGCSTGDGCLRHASLRCPLSRGYPLPRGALMGDSGSHLTMFLLAEATQRATAAPPCSGQLMELLGVQDHSRGGYQPTVPPGAGITNTNTNTHRPFEGTNTNTHRPKGPSGGLLGWEYQIPPLLRGGNTNTHQNTLYARQPILNARIPTQTIHLYYAISNVIFHPVVL